MQAYYLTRPLTLRASAQSRTLTAATTVGAPLTTELHIAAQNELRLVRSALQKTYPQEPVDQLIRLLSPSSLAQLPGMPAFLGARAFDAPLSDCPDNCLVTQLQALRAAHPARNHYRLLLINGFGTNLGDNLMGITAFRQALTVLRQQLSSVSVDVLLGWHSDNRLVRLFRAVEGIEGIRTQGMTFAELVGYQALFDTGGLLNLPGYGQRPMVDWYLWWLGLDPANIAAADKRNAVLVPDADRQWVASHLPKTAGPRLLINPKASVALRSMPDSFCVRLLAGLLASWPDAQIVVLQPLPIDDPRVLNLAAAITNVDQLAALVAAVDGLIGVDTYTAHLADATSTPAVTLYTTFLPELYPYYPLEESLVLANADQLPGWGRPKVGPMAWGAMAGAYEAAWQAWDPQLITTALRRALAKKTADSGAFEPRFLPPRPPMPVAPTRVVEGEGLAFELPLRQRQDPLARVLNRAIAELGERVVCAGDTVAVLGAGSGEAALGLARRVGPHGRLITIEPRRALHQLLCANLVRADLWQVEPHLAMPEGEGLACRQIGSFDLAAESSPLSLANSELPEPVICWPLDTLELTTCSLLVVSSPLARLEVLAGAKATLARLHPYVLVGVAALWRDRAAFEAFFAALDYRLRILELADSKSPGQPVRYGILVAEPIAGERHERDLG